MPLPPLSPSLECIEPVDVLVVLGRGKNDPVRAELALNIAEHVASHEASQERERKITEVAGAVGPLIIFCGESPWHRPNERSSITEGAANEQSATDLLEIHPEDYPHLRRSQFRIVGGMSTIASLVQVSELDEVTTGLRRALLTDELHNK